MELFTAGCYLTSAAFMARTTMWSAGLWWRLLTRYRAGQAHRWMLAGWAFVVVAGATSTVALALQHITIAMLAALGALAGALTGTDVTRRLQ